MSNFIQKENTGTLWPNDRKESDSHPDSKGSARIDGHDYWLSSWNKSSPNGPRQSLSFKRKDGTASRPIEPKILSMTAQAPLPRRDLDDDSVPF